MAVKTKSRKMHDRRKHMSMMLIFVVVLAVFGVSMAGSFRLQKRNQVYQEREQALEDAIADEEARAQEIEELDAYTKTKKYVEEVAKEKLGLVYEDEIIFKAQD